MVFVPVVVAKISILLNHVGCDCDDNVGCDNVLGTFHGDKCSNHASFNHQAQVRLTETH